MTTNKKNVIELDVRPILKEKGDPFEKIMTTVKLLKKSETFLLHAPFKPTPLLTIMKKKGFTIEINQLEKKHWTVLFRKEE
ncbi:DUF2249 domain-containing protein [Metabacillus malikii]|uniref:DUF2249 domain-containing protein n=1 Tax=Metabacillus malikii TaxID=1504265 RepID=A0ABT9ZBJ2_9BACI|nr:DUF2249 domain-containing protein [Metabacillus malikii]MDQ0229279.1 hypothetical protein [Metabacillus malikii]